MNGQSVVDCIGRIASSGRTGNKAGGGANGRIETTGNTTAKIII